MKAAMLAHDLLVAESANVAVAGGMESLFTGWATGRY